jgi:hypothetical protein
MSEQYGLGIGRHSSGLVDTIRLPVGTCFDMFGQVGTSRYRSGYVGTDFWEQDGHVGTGLHRSGLAETIRCRSGRVRTCRDWLDQVVTGPSMSDHVRNVRFRWGHVGTGCSGRTVLFRTGLDSTGLVGSGRDMSVHVWTYGNTTDLSGQVGTGLDSSRQFGYRSGHVSSYLERSEQVGTGRDMSVQIFGNRTDMSGQVCTGLVSSRQFGYRSGRVLTCRNVSGHTGTGCSRS